MDKEVFCYYMLFVIGVLFIIGGIFKWKIVLIFFTFFGGVIDDLKLITRQIVAIICGILLIVAAINNI